jgi:hypothetical protein
LIKNLDILMSPVAWHRLKEKFYTSVGKLWMVTVVVNSISRNRKLVQNDICNTQFNNTDPHNNKAVIHNRVLRT